MKTFSFRARCALAASLVAALVGAPRGVRAQGAAGPKMLVRTASFTPQVLAPGTASSDPSAVQAARVRVQGLVSRAIPGTTIGRSFGYVGWSVLQLPASAGYNALSSLRRVLGAGNVEPDYKVHATRIPNDPQFGQQYWLSKIGAPAAWDKTTGSSNVIVAVIDTGAQLSHPDLRDNLYKNSDGTIGFNAINPALPPEDDNVENGQGIYHGTHCAGTIGARGNNGLQVSGVNWTVKIIPVKFLAADGSGFDSDSIAGINFLLAQKAKGVNIRATSDSFGGTDFSQAQKDAFQQLGNAGILNFCAAGNDGANNDTTPHYPANFGLPSIVTVGASDQNDLPADFSDYGATTVDIFAPGVGILSLAGNSGTQELDGTSMATPCTAGAAALIWSVHPELSPVAMKALLLRSSFKLTSLTGKCVSGGRVDLAKALDEAGPIVTPTPVRTPEPSFVLSGTVYSDAARTVILSGATVTLSNGLRTTTDLNGKYVFSTVRVGSYNLQGALAGYSFSPVVVTGTVGQRVPQDLVATTPASVRYSINGITRNVLGRNVRGASIFLGTETVPVAVSGDGGAFSVNNLAPGNYVLSAYVSRQLAIARVTMDASGVMSLTPDATGSTTGRIDGNRVILQPVRFTGPSAPLIDPSAPRA